MNLSDVLTADARLVVIGFGLGVVASLACAAFYKQWSEAKICVEATLVEAGLGDPAKKVVNHDGTLSLVYYVDADRDRFVEVRGSVTLARRNQYLCTCRDRSLGSTAVLIGSEAVRDWLVENLKRMGERTRPPLTVVA